jgi:hypothetical protein
MAKGQEAAQLRKLQPKLRMVANGSTEVNALRAEHASAVKVPRPVARKVTPLRDQRSAPRRKADLPKSVRPGRLREAPDARVSVFLQLTEDFAELGVDPGQLQGVTAHKANMATAELPVAEAVELRERAAVAYVELGQPLAMPTPLVSADRVRAPATTLRRFGDARRHKHGEDVLIGLIDVGGFDFAHPDFLDDRSRTRFVRIWDQGGNGHPSPKARGTTQFDYGAEIRGEDLNPTAASVAARRSPGS